MGKGVVVCWDRTTNKGRIRRKKKGYTQCVYVLAWGRPAKAGREEVGTAVGERGKRLKSRKAGHTEGGGTGG